LKEEGVDIHAWSEVFLKFINKKKERTEQQKKSINVGDNCELLSIQIRY
jgi:hypothetical protein